MDKFTRESVESYRHDVFDHCLDRAEAGGYEHDFGDAFELFCNRVNDRAESTPRVLDVGCGAGEGAIPMTERGYRVFGVDLITEFLQAVRDRTRGRANVAQMDMRTLAVEEGLFDALWASASFYHVPRSDASQTATEFHTVLTPGAVLFCCVARGEGTNTLDDGRRITLWQPDEFRGVFQDAGFAIDQFDTPGQWLFLHATA